MVAASFSSACAASTMIGTWSAASWTLTNASVPWPSDSDKDMSTRPKCLVFN